MVMKNESPWNDADAEDAYKNGTVYSEEYFRKKEAHEKLVKERAETDGKIKFWGDIARILGLIALLGYAIDISLQGLVVGVGSFGAKTVVSALYTGHNMFWPIIAWILLIFAVAAPIRVAILSSQRKKHVFKEYLAACSGVILILLPKILMWILSLIV